ncbi:hypothetical protein HZB05_01420 [Candidatus Wolfebacteria bacterium]|nr:hypothetical protein [Candidatus Wolfebacteria bacterium]
MERFESIRPKDPETEMSFKIQNIDMDIQKLELKIEQEENPKKRLVLEEELKNKENELYKIVEKLNEFKERKNGIGHA